MGLIFEFQLLENHMEEELVVSLMDVLLGFHSLNLICSLILIGGMFFRNLALNDPLMGFFFYMLGFALSGDLVRAGLLLLEKRLILAVYLLESLKV